MKASKAFYFDQGDVGQHIDGALGERHAVDCMLELLHAIVEEYKIGNRARSARSLIIEMEDGGVDEEFNTEWLDDATDALQDATEPGLVWEWDGGDLVLLEDEGEDE